MVGTTDKIPVFRSIWEH